MTKSDKSDINARGRLEDIPVPQRDNPGPGFLLRLPCFKEWFRARFRDTHGNTRVGNGQFWQPAG